MISEKRITCIKELNVIFKRLNWKLLPENNKYPKNHQQHDLYFILIDTTLYFLRSFFLYEKHLNKHTTEQLDSYIVEILKPFCLKFNIKNIRFLDDHYTNINTIEIRDEKY